MKRSALLWLSHSCTVLFCIGSIWAIHQQPAGQSVSWYLSFFLFCIVALAITLQEIKLGPSSEASERREIYGLWSIVATVNIGYCIFSKITSKSSFWTEKDDLNFKIYAIATIVVICIALLVRKPLTDAVVRGWIGFALKAIPQFFLAWLMFGQPTASPSLLALVAGLITIALRLIRLGNPLKWVDWNRQKKGLAVAEYFNFVSWASIGVIWLIHSVR